MSALKFYLKDKKRTFYISASAVVILFYLFYRVISNEITSHYTLIKTEFICFVFGPLLISVFLLLSKKFFLVFLDVKKQEMKTDIITINNCSRDFCIDKFSGWYLIVKGRTPNNKVLKFWTFQRDLNYPNIYRQQIFEVTYYKYSKCIYEMKEITKTRKRGNNG